MRFSRSTAYGLRALGNLLLSGADSEVNVKPLKQVAKEEGISLKFLEKLFSQLKRKEIVKSVRGVHGGYYFGKQPARISLLKVLDALGEETKVFQCVGQSGKIICGKRKDCGALPVLQKVQKAVNQSLDRMTLEDII